MKKGDKVIHKMSSGFCTLHFKATITYLNKKETRALIKYDDPQYKSCLVSVDYLTKV